MSNLNVKVLKTCKSKKHVKGSEKAPNVASSCNPLEFGQALALAAHGNHHPLRCSKAVDVALAVLREQLDSMILERFSSLSDSVFYLCSP